MMQSLKKLLRVLKEFFYRKEKAKDIPDGERITRYILSKGQFAKTTGRVKYSAFIPMLNQKASRFEISVYRTTDVADVDIWEIGQKHVANPQSKKLYARGDLQAADIFHQNLQIEPDLSSNRPHDLHANIIGWPREKDEQKMIAIELAKEATLESNPSLNQV